MNNNKRNHGFSTLIILLIWIFSFSPLLTAEEVSPDKRILLLHSYHEGLTWTDGEDQGLRDIFRNRYDIKVYTEYLDSKRIPFEAIAGPFAEFLSQKYATTKFDVVIVSDNNALTFLSRYHGTLFPGVPVVFCGINNFKPDMLKGFDRMATGVIQALDPKGTVDLIQKLQPGLQSLVIVSGTTPTARAIREKVDTALAELEETLNMVWLDGLETGILLDRLANLSVNDAVLLCNFNRDAASVYYSHEESARMISKTSNAPVYAMEDHYIGTGVTGGYMNSSKNQGSVAARLCLEILQTGRIPKVDKACPNDIMFDYHAMTRFGLDESMLPPSAIIIGQPVSFYFQHKTLIWNVALIFMLMALGLFGLSYSLVGSRRAEVAIKNAQNYISSIINSMPSVLVGVDTNGTVTQWNAEAQRATGVLPEDAVEQPLTQVFPRLAAEMERVREAMDKREVMSDLRTVHQEGGETRYENVKVYPLIANGLEGAVIRIDDVTELMRVEDALRESEAKFRALVESSCDLIWEVNTEGVYTYASPQVEAMLGYKSEEVVGKTAFDLMPPEEAERVADIFKGVTEKGEPIVALENVNLHKDGRRIILETSGVPVLDAKGKVTGYRGVDRDITERKRAKEALEKRLVALTQPLDDAGSITFGELFNLDDIQRLQDEFAKATGVASIITHPDGTPITAPSNFCHLCRDIIRKTEKGCINCYKSDAALGRFNPDGPIIQPCMSGGLWDAGASISVGGRHIANWLIGQVRDNTQSEEKMREYARKIEANEEAVVEAFREVPAMSREQFGQVAQALFTLANQLSNTAYQNVQQARFITERKQAEERLKDSEKRSRAWLENSPVCTKILDLDFNLQYMSHAGIEGLGIDDITIFYGKPYPFDFYPESYKKVMTMNLKRVRETGEVITQEASVVDTKGNALWFHSTLVPVYDDDGRIEYIIVVSADITDRKRAEEEKLALERQVQHAQKLESLGVLAGGIAHDFNNILMSILGNADLALDELASHAPAHDNIQEIEKGAKRAAELAKQMLAYSGKGQFVIEPIDLNNFVEEMAHLLEVSISKKAMLKFNFTENLPTIDGDTTQIRQVIMNLITNASEAIGDKTGVIALSTGAIYCDRAYLDDVNEILRASLDAPLPEGRYICLEVADTGCGMNRDTIERIFDPFFTTKFTGRGLGMAAVLGIVRGHYGAINIYSEVDKGTTFKILFPASELSGKDAALKRKSVTGDTKGWQGKGTVLVVDDEETVGNVGKKMLTRIGFNVLIATDGFEGVEVFREHADEIVCVLLDLTMPHMDGEEAFREMRRIRADATVILCSGYSEQEATERFTGKGLAGFLQKPYNLAVLKEKMMNILILPKKENEH